MAATRAGTERWPRFVFIGLVLALVFNVVANAVWVVSAADGLKDLDSFLHSGAAYAKGLDPYDYYWWLRPEPISPEALNLNPPVSVYLFQPLTVLDREGLGLAFLAGTVAMVAVSVGLLMHAYPDKRYWLFPLVVAAMAGVWQMLWYLQIYAPLLLAMTAAWLFLRRGDWLLAALLIGFVIAVKPNYGIVALVIFAAGYYRLAIASVGTAGILSLVPILIDGPQIYWQWFHLTQHFDGYAWTSNASLVSVGDRLDAKLAGEVAAGVLAIGVLFLARRWRPDILTAVGLGTMCVILVGPVSWAGYTLLLLPYLFSIRWDGWTWAAAALLALPFAPEKAFSALGLDFSGVEGTGGLAQSVLPDPLITVVGAVVLPLIAAIYAWATLLLLARLCQRLAAENGDHLPSLRLRRRLRALSGLQTGGSRAMGSEQAVPVRVSSDL